MDWDSAVGMHNPTTTEPAIQRDEVEEDAYVGPRDGCGFLHRHKCDGAACDGSKDVPNDSDPFEDTAHLTDNEMDECTDDCPGCASVQDTDDTHREDEPGDWLMSGFSGVCSLGGEWFHLNDTIRADGAGGWECRDCVEDLERYEDDRWEEARRLTR
jgi:hypothetical protein